MQYITIKNWEKFQHYKDRNPPWIKLLVEIIDEFDENDEPKKFHSLPDSAKLTFILLACLRSRHRSKIPYKYDKDIKKKLGIKRLNLQPLIDAGFITIDSNSVAKPYQLATKTLAQRQRTETETETEKEKEKYLKFVFLTKEEYKKLVQRFGEKPTKKLIDDLDYYINNKKGKNPYTDHYRTLCKWAKKDNLTELPTPETEKEREAREKEGREKRREEQREHYGGWMKTRAKEEDLITLYKKDVTLRWLIRELRPEIEVKAKEQSND